MGNEGQMEQKIAKGLTLKELMIFPDYLVQLHEVTDPGRQKRKLGRNLKELYKKPCLLSRFLQLLFY